MPPNVALIWLCFNNLRHLPEVVASWEKLTYPKDRLTIVILPAHSPDGIAEVIRRDVLPRSGKDLPEIVIIDEENRGFTVNNNVGLQWAIDKGFDYAFLENGDLKLAPGAIDEAVRLAEADATIGAAQSLVCFWHDVEKVNVTGGMVHVAGYGFARHNGQRLSDISVQDGEEVAYASGAAVLYRLAALKKVGLFEEGFFMYHDDLELGLRLKIAGYRNVLAAKSLACHDYQFSRNPKKFVWMETYRWVVVLAYYKVGTLILLGLFLGALELGSWLMMLKGGTARVKLAAYRELLRPSTWKLMSKIRCRAQTLRVVPDGELLRLVTGRIEAQETSSPLMDDVINPVVDGIWRALRKLIVW